MGGTSRTRRETKWGLTEQELEMCHHYMETDIKERSFAKSYQFAYKCAGSTASGHSSRKFNKPHIKDYLDSFIQQRMDEVKITVNDALKVIKEIMENPEAKDADRLVACEKVLKMNNAYEKHEEAGAIKTYLGMDMNELKLEAKHLFEKVVDSGLMIDHEGKQGEYVDFKEIEDTYEDG